jgi:hypothetical protein
MPLYEYECPQKHRAERLEAFDSKDVLWCDDCIPGENNVMRRVISVPSHALIPGGTNAGRSS